MPLIGTSDLDVFPLALGGNVFGWTADRDASFEILDAFTEGGGDFIDTADSYSAWVDGHSGGESERIIGEWLASRRPKGVTVATKVSQHPEFRGLSAKNVRAAGLPDAVAYASIRNLARGIAEILRFPELGPIAYEGWEHVEAAQAAGKGVIIATMHFGNWEVLGGALAAKGLPLHVLVQPPSQDAFGKLFIEFRNLVGVTTHANSGAASLRPETTSMSGASSAFMPTTW